MNCYIPFYHVIAKEELPYIKYLYRYKNFEQFKQDIENFLFKYEICNNYEAKKNSFFLTFDDGFKVLLKEVVPLLKQKKVPAIFFINSDFVDNKNMFYRNKASIICSKLEMTSIKLQRQLQNKYNVDNFQNYILQIGYNEKNLLDDIGKDLDINFTKYDIYFSSEDILYLNKIGFNIGAHSKDHPLYGSLDLTEQIEQTVVSASFIENLGIKCEHFSFPFNANGVSGEFFDYIRAKTNIKYFYDSSKTDNRNTIPRFWMDPPSATV